MIGGTRSRNLCELAPVAPSQLFVLSGEIEPIGTSRENIE